MRITVCVKQVPDTGTDRELRQDDSTVARDAADAVINELDEFAIEEGLRLAEKHGGEVTILSMGPDQATESVRKALAMGADKGLHVSDPALHGSDALVTSAVLAAALSQAGFDLVVLGSESTDARTGCSPRCWPSGLACRSCRSRAGSRPTGSRSASAASPITATTWSRRGCRPS